MSRGLDVARTVNQRSLVCLCGDSGVPRSSGHQSVDRWRGRFKNVPVSMSAPLSFALRCNRFVDQCRRPWVGMNWDS